MGQKQPGMTMTSDDLFGGVPENTPAPPRKPQTPAPAPAPAAKAPVSNGDGYSAKDIEVLEGLEPVRRRPGMYIGGTDINALHHLFAEVIDNCMDEAIAGHASRIEVHLDEEGFLTVSDNGRGIPVDPHPKDPSKSALEIIMTTLHAGGKFDSKAYETSGGLHGVGISVVNALSDSVVTEVARDQMLYRQSFSRGKPLGGLEEVGKVHNRRGTTHRFHPDPEIFGPRIGFVPERIFRMSRAKAYLFGGVEIRWSCDESLAGETVPAKEVFTIPAASGNSQKRGSTAKRALSTTSSRAFRASLAPMARANGPSPGIWATASSIPTAIPFPPRMAARMNPGYERPCYAA